MIDQTEVAPVVEESAPVAEEVSVPVAEEAPAAEEADCCDSDTSSELDDLRSQVAAMKAKLDAIQAVLAGP